MPTKPFTEATEWRCKELGWHWLEMPGHAPKCIWDHKTKRSEPWAHAPWSVCVVPVNAAAKALKAIYQGRTPLQHWKFQIDFDAYSTVRVWEEDARHLLAYSDNSPAQEIGKFFVEYGFEVDSAGMYAYRKGQDVAKKKAKKKAVVDLQHGNAKARVYPDGRICIEHESAMEELWLKADDIADFAQVLKQVSEEVGLAPKSQKSGVSYQKPDLEPGQAYPMEPGFVTPSPGTPFGTPYTSQGPVKPSMPISPEPSHGFSGGLTPGSVIPVKPSPTANQIAIDLQRKLQLIELAQHQAVMAQEKKLQEMQKHTQESILSDKDFMGFLEHAMKLGKPEKYVAVTPESVRAEKIREKENFRAAIEKAEKTWNARRK